MGNLGETARPGNRGDQLAPLCNSRDQFLSRKEQPCQQLGTGVYPRSARIGKHTLPSTLLGSWASGSHPHAPPQTGRGRWRNILHERGGGHRARGHTSA